MQQTVAVPAYFRPGPTWSRLARAYPVVDLAVMNPSSGPGTVRDASYARQVGRARAVGLRVLGYVATGYALRPPAVVAREIDAYLDWYGVDGVFFDEASADPEDQPYYAALAAHLKASGGAITALNPGTWSCEPYMEVADVLLTFEGDAAAYLRVGDGPAWVRSYPPERFWHAVYGAETAGAMRDVLRTSRERHAGRVFVTPGNPPNPWGALPASRYWHAELAAVRAGA